MGVAGCLGGCLGPASSACITGIKTARRGGAGGGWWKGPKFSSLSLSHFLFSFSSYSLFSFHSFHLSTLKRKKKKRKKEKREEKPKIGQK